MKEKKQWQRPGWDEYETLGMVLNAAARLYTDIFHEPHPFELADQPAIIDNLRDAIAGCDNPSAKKELALPTDSVFDPAYIKLTLGLS